MSMNTALSNQSRSKGAKGVRGAGYMHNVCMLHMDATPEQRTQTVPYLGRGGITTKKINRLLKGKLFHSLPAVSLHFQHCFGKPPVRFYAD